jgi:hypothetical protein
MKRIFVLVFLLVVIFLLAVFYGEASAQGPDDYGLGGAEVECEVFLLEALPYRAVIVCDEGLGELGNIISFDLGTFKVEGPLSFYVYPEFPEGPARGKMVLDEDGQLYFHLHWEDSWELWLELGAPTYDDRDDELATVEP